MAIKKLAEQNRDSLKTEESREIFDAEGAAKYLHLCTDTVYRLARTDQLPAKKVGQRWIFSRKKLLEWVEGRM